MSSSICTSPGYRNQRQNRNLPGQQQYRQGCEPKTDFTPVFRLANKNETETPTRLCLTAHNHPPPDRNRPTLSVKNRKPTESCLFSVHFRFTTLAAAWNKHTTLLNLLFHFSWFHRETDREVFVFSGSLFFSVKKTRPKPTDISVKNRKTDRGHFHFRFTTLPGIQAQAAGDARRVRICLHFIYYSSEASF